MFSHPITISKFYIVTVEVRTEQVVVAISRRV